MMNIIDVGAYNQFDIRSKPN